MDVYILRDVPLLRDGCVLTGVPLLCDGCVYTHGCSTVVGWVCIYSRVFRCCGMGVYIVTGVPLLRDRDVYTHGCSTALGWVCIKSYIYIHSRVFHCTGMGVYLSYRTAMNTACVPDPYPPYLTTGSLATKHKKAVFCKTSTAPFICFDVLLGRAHQHNNKDLSRLR